MPTSARKNIHGKQGVRFKAGWTASKNKSQLRNLVTDLIIHEKIQVTSYTGKQLVALSDRLITYAKKGDIGSRRMAGKYVRNILANEALQQTALQKLFDEIGPRYVSRNGGYTKMLKIDRRRGDDALLVQVELVK